MLFDGLHVRKEEIGDQGAGGTALVLFMVQHTCIVHYLDNTYFRENLNAGGPIWEGSLIK